MTVEIRLRAEEKKQYQNVLNRVKEIEIKRENLLSEYNSISETEIDRLKKIVPEKVNSITLLNNLNALAARYNLVLKDYKVSNSDSGSRDVVDTSSTPPYKTTTISLSMSGQYEQFLSFLNELESALSLIDVVNLNIMPGISRPGQSAQSDFTLEANTYSLR